MSIHHLIYLVHKKNELNKKRLRFKRWAKREVEGCIPKKYAYDMWQLTAREMRTMTAEIRRLRSSLDAKLHWGFAQWRVIAVSVDDRKIKVEEFPRLAADHLMDQILLVKSTDRPQRGCLRSEKRQA